MLGLSRSANARSRADWKRRSGAFSKAAAHDALERSAALSGRSGFGSSRRIALIVSALDAPANARRPESIS